MSGVEVYEGLLVKGVDSTADTEAVVRVMSDLLLLTSQCDAKGLFTHPHIVVSAGGSAAFDVVADQLQPRARPSFCPVLCYPSYVVGVTCRMTTGCTTPSALTFPRDSPLPLPSSSLPWRCGAGVQSLPQPRTAIVALGRRTSPVTNTSPSPLGGRGRRAR